MINQVNKILVLIFAITILSGIIFWLALQLINVPEERVFGCGVVDLDDEKEKKEELYAKAIALGIKPNDKGKNLF